MSTRLVNLVVFVPVTDPKTAPNRVHLDLVSPSAAAQTTLVAHLLDLGATRADPEGDELCVLSPR